MTSTSGTNSALERLGGSKYVAVASYRKDGTPVSTPVWVAKDGDRLVFWTVADSYKIKRIRRNPAVCVVECDVRGNKHRGFWVRGTATVLDAGESQRARDLIAKKYGVLGWLTVKGSELRRSKDGSVGVEIVLDED